MIEQVNKDILSLINETEKDKSWLKIKVTFIFSESGSLGWTVDLDDHDFYLDPFDVSPKIKNLREYFIQVKYDSQKHFNKVDFEIFRDGSYKANYHWDDAEAKNDKLKTAEVFPLWLHDRFLQFLFEAGNGDIDNWQRGVFKVKINNDKSVVVEAILFNDSKPFDARLDFPQAVYDGIMSHYKITNNGSLSDGWQKWNTLIIHTRRTSVDLEKDVTYSLEQSPS